MYQVSYTKKAIKSLSKLDNNARYLILKWIHKNLVNCSDPLTIPQMKYLKGKRLNYVRYRVGDYRIICFIEGEKLIINVIDVGHRKEIYQ